MRLWPADLWQWASLMVQASALAMLGLSASHATADAGAPMTIEIDAAAARHPISPLIYGASFASPAVARDLGLALDRSGGDSASLYNWRAEYRGAGRDWFFESVPIAPTETAQYGHRFVDLARAGGAEPIITVPMTGWAARPAPNGGKLAAFSIAKYGPQFTRDSQWFPDAGDGRRPYGLPISGNDPLDAAIRTTPADTQAFLADLVARFGPSARGGVRFYALDNEVSVWHEIHRDVHPIGVHASEQAAMSIATARLIHAADPGAKVIGPEAWGWGEYRYSGYDQQYGKWHGYIRRPDRESQTGGMDFLPWLLNQWRQAGAPVDVISVHFYPQGGEFADNQNEDVSPAMQARRNRSTRALWDPGFVDESWIAEPVALIPRLRGWVDRYYRPGTPIALTEYSWGAEGHMKGATAEADVLGILGREGVYIAARWMAPAPGSPTYLAMKLYRNADDAAHGFGETSIATRAPDPDRLAAFGAARADGAITVMLVNKPMDRPAQVDLHLAHVGRSGRFTFHQLVSGTLRSGPKRAYADGHVPLTLPAQSVTLLEITPDERPR
jgi:hypothetical protein